MMSDTPLDHSPRTGFFRVVPLGLIVVMALAAIIRVLYVFPLNNAHLDWNDERDYDKVAWHLAETGHYESNPYDATPVLPTFLAIVYKVFGHDFRAVRIVQALLSALLVLAMFRIVDTLFGRKTAYLTALGIAFYPPNIYLAGVFYAEYLFTLLIAVTVFLLIQWQQLQRARWLVAAGVLMGLCRPVFLMSFPFVVAYVWWLAPRETRFRQALILCAVASMTILPWTLRNAVVFRKFLPISTGFGMHLWRANNDVALGDAEDRYLMPLDQMWQDRAQKLLPDDQRAALTAHLQSMVAGYDRVDEITHDHEWSAEGLRWIKAHPGKFIVLCGRRVLTLYTALARMKTKTELSSGRFALIAALSFYPLLGLGLAGMVLAARKCKASLLLHGVIAGNVVPYLLTPPCTRYRLPIDGYWIAFAALTVVTVWEGLAHKRSAVS